MSIKDKLNQANKSVQFANPVMDYSSNLNLAADLLPTYSEQFYGNRIEGLDVEKYSKYLGDTFNPYTDINLRRHDRQSWQQSLGHSLNQAVVGSIVGQTLEGVGYLLDLPQYIDLARGTEKEFGNWLSDIGKDLNTWTQEATPIYTDPNKEGQFNFGDWTWWMKNLPSVASTLSLLIPSSGAVKGISMLGKALNIGTKLGKTATWAATGIGQAVVSRHMENLMEASSVAEELKHLEGTVVTADQAKEFQKNYGVQLNSIDKEGNFIIDSNAANEIAAKAASNTYKYDWAMVVQDIPQYLLLNTPFGKATEKLTASIAKKLGQSYVPTLAKGLTAKVADAAGEGGEEAYQFVVGERFKELAMADAGLIDRRDLSEALKDYTKQGEFWTSAFFGAIGAGLMQTVGKPLNKMINRVKGIESQDERRMKDLDAWKDRVQMFNKHMVVAEMLNNPHLYESMRNDLSTEMAVKAAENGNLDYMIQTIDAISNAKEQDMSILGITQEDVQAAKEYNPNLISDLKRTGEIYQKNLNTHGKQFAAPLTINERKLEFLDKDIREFKTTSDQLYNSVPNIDKLSPEGSELIKLKSQVDNFKDVRKSLVKELKVKKNSEDKTAIQSRINELDHKSGVLTIIYNEAVKSYSKENKSIDSKIEYKSKEFDAYKKSALSLQYKEEHRESLKNDLDELRTYKGQEKYIARERKKAEATLKEAVAKAKTAEEISNVAAAAEGTAFDKSTKKDIDEQANIEAMNNKITADVFSTKEETETTQNIVDTQNEQEFRDQVKELANKFGERYTDDKNKINNYLYFSDYTKIKALINNIKEDISQIAQFNNTVNGGNPQSFIDYVEKILTQRDINHNPNAKVITDLLYNYFNKSAESSILVNGQAQQAAKEAEVIDSSTDQYIPTEEDPRFYKDANKGRVLITTAGNNIPIATSYEKNGELIPLLPRTEIDNKFLENFGVSSSSTLHIELNEIDEGYNPKQPKDKFNAYNRRYRVVYYIDGNVSNKHVTNRKVIGLLPSYKPVGVNNKSAKTMADIKIIRDMLIKQFPIDLNKTTKSNKVNSGITIKAAGYSMKYTQSKSYNSPITILKNHISNLLKQGNISKELATDIESVGGYYLGYVNNSGNIIFSNTNLANINLKSVKDNGVSRSGEMFIAVPNPARPSEMSLIRVFKKNLRELVKTMPEFVKERKNDAMKLMEADLKAQKASAKGISTITINKIKAELAFTSNSSKFLLQSLTLEDLQNKESEGYEQLQSILEDSWLNFNKKNINTRNFTAIFGTTIEEGPFNKVMDKYLGGNIQEGKIFENIQVIMDTTPLTKKSIAKTKNEVKEVKKVVTEKKESLQPSIEKQTTIEVGTSKQVEITKQDKGVTVTPKRTAFNVKNDTDIPTNPEALASKMTPKVESKSDEDEKFRPTGLKLKVEALNKSKERISPDAELTWIKSKLPHVEVKDLKEIQSLLNEVVKGGYEAVGAMYNAAIYLNNSITSGTVFHEAFHVLFNYSLSDKDREYFIKDVPGKTLIEKEEFLADQFADYLVSDQAATTIRGAIRKFFRQLKILIKALIGANVSSVRELADRADLGFYKKLSSTNFEDTTLRTKVENWSFEKTREGAETIANHIMVDLIPGIRNSNPELSLKSDVEILQLYTTKDNPYKIFRAAYLSLAEMYDQMLELDENDSRLDLLYDLITNLYIDNDTRGELVGETIRVLANNHGIYINIDKVESTISENGEEANLIGNTLQEYKENWQVEFSQRSAKDNAPTRVKNFIRYMETGEYNSFGMPKYVEYDDTYNSLLSDLEGSKSVEDLMFNLQEGLLFHPEYQQILDQMEDKSFATDMLQAFSRDLYSYSIVLEKNGQYIVTESNRKGVANTIISNWTNSIIQSNIISIDKTGNTFVDIEKSVALKTEFDSLVSTLLKNKEIDSSIFQELSNITKEFGFEITPKVFEYVQTLKPKYLREFYLGGFSLNTILDKFTKGLNPFDTESAEDINNIKGEANSIKAIARIVKKASPELFENSFFDVEGNRVYAHNVPTYLSSFINEVTDINKIQNYLNSKMKDHFFNSGKKNVPSNYILKKLDNAKNDKNTLKEALKVSFVDGLSEPGNKLGYPDMTYADLQVLSLASYFNNANKTYSMFRMPVFSDGGRMAMVRIEKPSTSKIALNELVQLAEKEYTRITLLQKNGGNGISNYNSEDNKNLDKGFRILPMLNGKVTKSPVVDRVNITKILDNYFSELAETYYNSLINNKVLVTKGKGFDLDKSRIDKRILANRTNEQFKEFIKEFMINDFLVRSSMSILTVGDPAFYSSKKGSVTVDYTKRAKEIMSPKSIPDTTASYTEYNSKGEVIETVEVFAEYGSIYLEDANIGSPSNEVIFTAIKDLEDTKIISPSKAKQLRVAYSAELDKNGKGVIKQTDGQAYTTLPFYRQTMVSFNKWTDKHQSAYHRLKKSQGTANDIALMLQPIKPFMFTQVYNSELKRFVPIQHKNSEYVLLPQLVNRNPKLEKLYNYMTTNNVGVANFNSAVKVGGFGSVNLDEMSEEVQPIIHLIPTIDRGVQQETPEHIVDAENLFGTQIRKLIMSDLFEGTTYFEGKTAEELYQLYEDLIVQDLKEAYESVESKFIDENGELNYQKIHNVLIDEARKRNKGEEFEKAIELINRTDGTRRTQLPLFHPLFANTTESLITSIFKNNVTKQKTTGAAVVQVTDFGLSKELKLVFNKTGDGLLYAEVMLPAWSSEFFKDFLDEDGNVDFDMAERGMPEEIFEMIGYRIPTEDKYSMLPLKVVGFLPFESGGSIMLPAEITTISGSDFDIDKMYLMMKAFKRDSFGNYEVVKYDESKNISDNSKIARDNMKIDLMMSVLRNKHTLEAMLTPGGYEYNREVATMIMGKLGIESSLSGLFDIFTQDEMAIRNMTGKKLVGIAANHNAHHALRQHYDLGLVNPIKFDNNEYSKFGGRKALSQFKYEDGKLTPVKDIDRTVSRNLSEFLAAVVDNAKDPLASFMNYNTITADIISTMIGLGIDTHTAILFINQPVVREVIEAQKAEPNKYITSIIKKVTKKYQVDLKQDIPNLNTKDLLKNVKDSTNDYQKSVLVAFNKYQKYAKDLGDVIRASTADTRGLGASIAHGESITKLQDKILTKGSTITGVEDLFNGGETITIMQPATIIQDNDSTNDIVSILNSKASSDNTFYKKEVGGIPVDIVYKYANISFKNYDGSKDITDNKELLNNYSSLSEYSQSQGSPITLIDTLIADTDLKGIDKFIEAFLHDEAADGMTFVDYAKLILNKYAVKTLDKNVGDLFEKESFEDISDKFYQPSRNYNRLEYIVNNNKIISEEDSRIIKKVISNFVSKFTEYGITNPIEKVLNKAYPYNNQLFTSIKESINDELTIRNLSPEERNYINRNIVSFLLSRFEFFEVGSRDEIVNDIPKRLLELRKKYGEEFKSPLTARLNFENKSDRIPINVVSFNNVGKLSEGQRVRIQQSWADMLSPSKTPNIEIREFAEDLVRYSYYTSGLNFTPNSFGHMIPVDAYISLIKDSKGLTISDVLYNELDAYNALSGETIEVSDATNTFLNQFYRNNYTNPTYVPRLNEDRSNFTTKAEHRITVDPSQVTDDSLYTTEYYGETKVHTGKRFIADKDGNRVKLYTFVRSDTNGVLIYERTAPLGIPNYITEYNRNGGTFMESTISSNNKTINKSKIIIDNNKNNAAQLDEVLNNKPKINTIPNNEDLDEFEKICPVGSI